MHQKLIKLYEDLKKEENCMNDLAISGPDNWDDESHICFQQMIIHYKDGFYDVSDIDEGTPTFKFSTIKEVIAYIDGYYSLSEGFREIYTQSERSDVDNAFNLGYYTQCKINFFKEIKTLIHKHILLKEDKIK